MLERLSGTGAGRVEFAPSPCAGFGFLRVLMFPPPSQLVSESAALKTIQHSDSCFRHSDSSCKGYHARGFLHPCTSAADAGQCTGDGTRSDPYHPEHLRRAASHLRRGHINAAVPAERGPLPRRASPEEMRNALFMAFGISMICAQIQRKTDMDFASDLKYTCSWNRGACREYQCKQHEFATPDSCPQGILCCRRRQWKNAAAGPSRPRHKLNVG
ncbi:uncharacterized protein LOC129709281 [Leucoraja erinacea]|uniref:uncharacterized protein LOC129709281 n=1 Tax=Leucoraja erinaceus TaxID=7782 RepID=UPI00245424C5|nr:uncharacterized protein LOC129709281 [Leucoraja erinacea]